MAKEYNERLFNKKTIRGKMHFARYDWLQDKLAKYCPEAQTILELGCFDGKTIDFLPKEITQYHGFDANWENGLDKAKAKYKGDKVFEFFESKHINEFAPTEKSYDVSICMETMEHLPLKDVESYIQKLAEATGKYSFVSVPNEKGMMLLIKYFVKKYKLKNISSDYTTSELFNGFIGRTHKVKRVEGGHKGFNYSELIKSLEKHFTVKEISGVPFNILPRQLSFTIGVVLEKK